MLKQPKPARATNSKQMRVLWRSAVTLRLVAISVSLLARDKVGTHRPRLRSSSDQNPAVTQIFFHGKQTKVITRQSRRRNWEVESDAIT
jgi:hypothetical protein